jgi:hypothetical protein
LAALDAFGPPWTPANCRARIGEKSPQTMHSWQHASSICIWWLQIPNMYIFHLGNGHVCKSFDWLQKTLTSSIVQIKPSGGSLLTLYSTLQHRQMMQRKTFQEYHTSMTKHRLKLCEWNTISFFDLVLRTSSRIPVELKKSKWHTHSSLLKGYHFSCNIRTTQEARTCEAWFQLTFRPKNGTWKPHIWYQLSPFTGSNVARRLRCRVS